MDIEPLDIQVFPEGHGLYPNGCVIVTDEDGTTEYTLEAWHALQQSQPE
ncbi:hypothetical protein [Kordiimonas aquimaris]|nr:hypothetical protein [Kordiimonas aquimaris]